MSDKKMEEQARKLPPSPPFKPKYTSLTCADCDRKWKDFEDGGMRRYHEAGWRHRQIKSGIHIHVVATCPEHSTHLDLVGYP